MERNESGRSQSKPFTFLKRGQGTARFLPKYQQPLTPNFQETSTTRKTSTPRQDATKGFPDASKNLFSPIPQETPVNIRPRTAETRDSGLEVGSNRSSSRSESSPQQEINQDGARPETPQHALSATEDDSQLTRRFQGLAPDVYERLNADLNAPSNEESCSNQSHDSNFVYRREMYETATDSAAESLKNSSSKSSKILSEIPKPKNVIVENWSKKQNSIDSARESMQNRSCPSRSSQYSFENKRHNSTDTEVKYLKNLCGSELKLPKANIRIPEPRPMPAIVHQPDVSLLNTPMVPDADEVVENTAEQLRALIYRLEIAILDWEKRKRQLELARRLELERLEKQRKQTDVELAREKKALKDKLVQVAAEKKIKDDEIALLTKQKLEADEQVSHWKSECCKNQVNCASMRTQVRKLTEKSDEFEKDYKKMKEQKDRYEKQYMLTSDRLTFLQQQIANMNRQDQRQPMQQKNVQRKPSVPRFQKPQLNLPLVIPGKSAAPTPIRSVHNSSVSTASKAVHWNPRIAETYAPSISDDEVFEDENLEGVLERNLPGDKVFLREDLDLKDYLRRSYSIGDAVVTWSQNKVCKCEAVLHEKKDWWCLSRSSSKVNPIQVVVKFFNDTKQYQINFGTFKIMSFPSNQVEIHHPNNDLTVITSDGCRHEHFYTQRGHYKEEHNYITSKRFYDDGTVEELDKNEERSSLRIDGSYVKTTWNEPIKEHTYFHPEFKVTRSDAEGLVGSISLKFYYPGTEQMQYIQVNICPEHAVAKVKHCSGIKGDKDYKSALCTENSHCLHFMR